MSKFIGMLIASARKRKRALAFYESTPNCTYIEIARQFSCSIEYARQMISKARKERLNG